MNTPADFCGKIRFAIRKYGMKIGKTVVGFSGGSDSVSLLHYLSVYGDKNDIVAVHVNHMIRGADADADELFCKKFCETHGICFESVRVNVPLISNGTAVEETARKLRYEALIRMAEKHHADSITLAHNANDNAETIVFNLARGCGLSGMGIPPVRPSGVPGIEILRPMILCTKRDVLDYICTNRLEYVTDATNKDTNYARNDIRETVIPELTKINSKAVENMSDFSEKAAADEDFIDRFAEDFMKKRDFSLSLLSSLHPAVLSRVLMKLYEENSAAVLSQKNIRDISGLIRREENGSSVSLPDSRIALVADGRLRIVSGAVLERILSAKEYRFSCGEDISAEELGFRITHCRPETEPAGCRIFHAALPHGWAVRSKETGDTIYYGTLTKKIKKMTTEIPLDARQRRPVFVWNEKVIWYPGFSASDDVKQAENKEDVYYIENIF